MILELDGDARARSSVLHTLADVGQSTTRWRTSVDREERSALRMSWSCCFHVKKAGKKPELKAGEVAEISLCGEGHIVEPSTKENTPWPIKYGFICIRQNR